MKTNRLMITAAVLLAAAFQAQATGSHRASIRVAFDAHPPIVVTADGTSYPMIFTEESARATVTVTWIHNVTLIQGGETLPAQRDDAQTLRLDPQWWRQIDWQITDSRGQIVSVETPRLLHHEVRAEARTQRSREEADLLLRNGEAASARFEFGSLPKGEYAAKVALALPHQAVASKRVVFAIRTGDESADVRRVFLRARLQRAREYSAQKGILAELIRLEPDNASNHEYLGDLAIEREPVDTALAHYDRALSILAERATSSPTELDMIEQKMAELQDVRGMLIEYKSRPEHLRLSIEFEELGVGKRYVLRHRATGRVVRATQ